MHTPLPIRFPQSLYRTADAYRAVLVKYQTALGAVAGLLGLLFLVAGLGQLQITPANMCNVLRAPVSINASASPLPCLPQSAPANTSVAMCNSQQASYNWTETDSSVPCSFPLFTRHLAMTGSLVGPGHWDASNVWRPIACEPVPPATPAVLPGVLPRRWTLLGDSQGMRYFLGVERALHRVGYSCSRTDSGAGEIADYFIKAGLSRGVQRNKMDCGGCQSYVDVCTKEDDNSQQ